MEQWISAQTFADRIIVASDPGKYTDKVFAAIVVNAVRDHEEAATWCISHNIPVLIEKPVTLRYTSIRGLLMKAKQNDVAIYPAHVFLFTYYLSEFKRSFGGDTPVEGIEIYWTDPANEQRYGEHKSYDPSLPLFDDWLPHIVSVLSIFEPISEIVLKNVEFGRGGALLIINISIRSIACRIHLARNVERRRRNISVTAGGKISELDFSVEPGVIKKEDGETTTADVRWTTRPRPTQQMLRAFLQSIETGCNDSRFDFSVALKAAELSENVREKYEYCRNRWLANLSPEEDFDDGFRYAATELLSGCGKGRVNVDIAVLESAFNTSAFHELLRKAVQKNSVINFLKQYSQI